jgi:hypothetical protein
LLVLILGGVPSVLLFLDIQMKNEAQNWPTTTGTVIYSQVESKTDEDGTTYHAAITYQYEVNGIPYTSSNYRSSLFGGETYTSNYQQMLSRIQEFPQGSECTVYYDPENPSNACLKPGIPVWEPIVLGAVIIVSLVSILVALKANFQNRTAIKKGISRKGMKYRQKTTSKHKEPTSSSSRYGDRSRFDQDQYDRRRDDPYDDYGDYDSEADYEDKYGKDEDEYGPSEF